MFFLRDFFLSLLFVFGLTSCLYAEMSDLDDDVALDSDLLFVSLGSMCEPAHMLRFCEMRKAAFPFDWIVSFDGESIIEMLENDFQDFLNQNFFKTYGAALLHTNYHLEFLHEGDWGGNQYLLNMEKLKTKYERRIERFRQLKNYSGKVIFLRASYLYSMNDPHRFYKYEANIEITEEYSLRLYGAIKEYFPDLDFSLIIINMHYGEEIVQEKALGPNLRIFSANPSLETPIKIASYNRFFNQLIRDLSTN